MKTKVMIAGYCPARKLLSVLILMISTLSLLADDWRSNNGWDTWADSEKYEITGYLETTGLTVLPRSSDSGGVVSGFQNLLRLKLVFEPSSNLSVTLEGDYLDQRGSLNRSVRTNLIGLPANIGEQSTENYSGFKFDYAYGSLSHKWLDLRIGRQPIAWGTAYAFNPTDVANPSLLNELAGVEPPGLTAISPSITIGQNWALEGYLGFEDRNRTPASASELKHIEDYPLGVKLKNYFGVWDFALAFLRSSELSQLDGQDKRPLTEENVAFEFAGSIGNVTLYGEALYNLNGQEKITDKAVNSAFGFRYQLLDDLGLQMEYHRRGSGANNSDDYDAALRLQGGMAGRDYLVSVADFVVLNDDIRIIISSLANLNDYSVAIFPEISYTFIQDLELKLGGIMFSGRTGSEFNGRFQYGIGENDEIIEIDVGRPQLYISCTWYF